MTENPWIRTGGAPSPAPVEPSTPVVETSGPVVVTGPQEGVPAPDTADRLPSRPTYMVATTWWLGAHGGAGESAMTALALGSRAAGHAWPQPSQPGTTNTVVVLARTNYAGLSAAQRAAIEWASGSLGDGIRVAGLVTIADAPGRLPKELRQLAALVQGGFPRTWSLPWVDAWRFGPVDPSAPLPKEYAQLLSDLNLTPTVARS